MYSDEKLSQALKALVDTHLERLTKNPEQMFKNEDLALMFNQVEQWWEIELDPLKQ